MIFLVPVAEFEALYQTVPFTFNYLKPWRKARRFCALASV